MARRRYNPRQPRDRMGRWKKGQGGALGKTKVFGSHTPRASKRALPVPPRGQRIRRAAATTAVVVAGNFVVPVAGSAAALAYRRHRQRQRGETGLRSTLTGRRLN